MRWRSPTIPRAVSNATRKAVGSGYLTSQELARLGDALRIAETTGLPWNVNLSKPKSKHTPKEENRRTVLDPFAVAAIRLLILTGARLREVLHADGSMSILSVG